MLFFPGSEPSCRHKIFARGLNGRQFLVYSMAYAAAGDLAMVLPLPVLPNPREDALRSINLGRCPKFFRKEICGLASVCHTNATLLNLRRSSARIVTMLCGSFPR